MVSRVWICILLVCSSLGFVSAASEEHEFVLTLDSSNFSEIISQHPFIVVEFYAPWCGHCKKLAPEYEKAASILRNHDPAVVLAKVDANDEINKGLATEYEVQGFPTLKILRNGGKSVQDYNGPRVADGIVEYLKKQAGPASAEIKSLEDANLINEKKIFIVGVFPEFSGEEFQNFTAVADKLRAHYDFGHTLDSGLLPRGEKTVKGPLVRLLKPFDELFVDFEDFHVASLESFIQEASVPIVTFFTKDPENHPFVLKFFEGPNVKAMLFVDFGSDKFESFKSKYHDVAVRMKGKGLSFLMGNLEASDGAFQYFGLKKNQVPLIIVQNTEGEKYLKANLEPEHVESWLNEYIDGKVNPYRKSEPIPETSNEPVKTVVADNFDEAVFNSGKNVLIEFYAPWCGHCKKLAPILDEVAISFQTDADVIIAKLDATANDFPRDKFDVKGYPTLYFYSASGKLLQYDSGRTKEDIIDFIQNNRDHASQQEPIKDEL